MINKLYESSYEQVVEKFKYCSSSLHVEGLQCKLLLNLDYNCTLAVRVCTMPPLDRNHSYVVFDSVPSANAQGVCAACKVLLEFFLLRVESPDEACAVSQVGFAIVLCFKILHSLARV